MHLVVGLGNPGVQYLRTRHNIGFMIVDEFASRHGWEIHRNRFKGLMAKVEWAGMSCLLLKPETYMNRSGEAVGEAARYFKIPAKNITVVHDDVDLDFGRLQVKQAGSTAGHKGLRSIAQHLPENDFARLRVGVGRPRFGEDIPEYVLNGFYPDEQETLDAYIERGAKALETILKRGPAKAANSINRKAKPEKVKADETKDDSDVKPESDANEGNPKD